MASKAPLTTRLSADSELQFLNDHAVEIGHGAELQTTAARSIERAPPNWVRRAINLLSLFLVSFAKRLPPSSSNELLRTGFGERSICYRHFSLFLSSTVITAVAATAIWETSAAM